MADESTCLKKDPGTGADAGLVMRREYRAGEVALERLAAAAEVRKGHTYAHGGGDVGGVVWPPGSYRLFAVGGPETDRGDRAGPPAGVVCLYTRVGPPDPRHPPLAPADRSIGLGRPRDDASDGPLTLLMEYDGPPGGEADGVRRLRSLSGDPACLRRGCGEERLYYTVGDVIPLVGHGGHYMAITFAPAAAPAGGDGDTSVWDVQHVEDIVCGRYGYRLAAGRWPPSPYFEGVEVGPWSLAAEADEPVSLDEVEAAARRYLAEHPEPPASARVPLASGNVLRLRFAQRPDYNGPPPGSDPSIAWVYE